MKALAVSATCSASTYAHTVTVPVGSTAQVQIPSLDGASGIIFESGTLIWNGAAFEPGVPGINYAFAANSSVFVGIGSGTYNFVLS